MAVEHLPGVPQRHPLLYALSFAPAEQTSMLVAIWELTHELDGLARIAEPQVAAVKLPWWHEELGRWARGEARHPATRQLRELASNAAAIAAVQDLLMVNALEQTSPRYGEEAEFWARCEQHALGLNVVAAYLDADGEVARGYRLAGSALIAIERLMNVAAEARAGRIRLPLEPVAAAGLDTRALTTPAGQPGFADLAGPLAEAARERLAASREVLEAAGAPADHRYALVLAALYDACARRLGSAEPDMEWPSPVRQLWIAWQTARRSR